MNSRSFFNRILFLFLLLNTGALRAETVDRIVAKVGSEVITLSDVTRAIAEQRQFLKDTVEPAKIESELAKFKANVVEEMILQEILQSEIKKEKISASMTEVDADYAARLRQFGLTPQQMEEKLRADGLSVASYKDSIKKQIERRNFIQKKIAPNIVISDLELQKEYQANISQFQKYKKLRFIEVMLLGDKFSSADELKKTAEEIGSRLKKGVSAADLIKKFSSGAFAANGGDSGLIEASSLRQEIQDVLQTLKPGGLSPVLSTGSGLFIFKLVARADPEPIPYSKVSGILRARLGDKLVEKELRHYLLGVRERTYVEIIK